MEKYCWGMEVQFYISKPPSSFIIPVESVMIFDSVRVKMRSFGVWNDVEKQSRGTASWVRGWWLQVSIFQHEPSSFDWLVAKGSPAVSLR
jgi:hypothetical protein